MWLHLPETSCRSVAVSAGSNWGSGSPAPISGPCAGSSRTGSACRCSSKECDRACSTTPQFGAMSGHSTSRHGADESTCCAAATPVSQQERLFYLERATGLSSHWLLEMRSSPTKDDGGLSQPSCLVEELLCGEWLLEVCQGSLPPTNTRSTPDAACVSPKDATQGCLTGQNGVTPATSSPPATSSARSYLQSNRQTSTTPCGGSSADISLTGGGRDTGGESASPSQAASPSPVGATRQTSWKSACSRQGCDFTEAKKEPSPGSPSSTPGSGDSRSRSGGGPPTSCCQDMSSSSPSARPRLCSTATSPETATERGPESCAPPPSARRWPLAWLCLPSELTASWPAFVSVTFRRPNESRGASSIRGRFTSCRCHAATVRRSSMASADGSLCDGTSLPESAPSTTSLSRRTNLTPLTVLSFTTANLFRPSGASEEEMTNGTCGRTSPESSVNVGPGSASSRTCPTTSTSDFLRSGRTWRQWATALRRASSRRLSWARRTFAKGYTYWRTPAASEVWPGLHLLTDRDGNGPRPGHRVYRRTKTGARVNQTVSLGLQVRLFGPHTWMTGTAGEASRLTYSPRFGEWLMGLPVNWTAASGPSATEWCRWWRRMRTALSRLR